MILIFWVSFLSTFIIVRTLTNLTHDSQNYPHTKNLTGYLRKITNKVFYFGEGHVKLVIHENNQLSKL